MYVSIHRWMNNIIWTRLTIGLSFINLLENLKRVNLSRLYTKPYLKSIQKLQSDRLIIDIRRDTNVQFVAFIISPFHDLSTEPLISTWCSTHTLWFSVLCLLFFLFLLTIVLSVHLKFTPSDFPFGIFKPFLASY